MNEPNKRNLLIAVGAVIAILAIVVGTMVVGTDDQVGIVDVFTQDPNDPSGGTTTTVVTDKNLPPPPSEPIAMTVPAAPALFASVVVDLYAPEKVLGALKKNPWLAQTIETPLGRGFLGSWTGFFGTRGGELGAGFSGSVLDFVGAKLLAQPARVLWMGSDRRRSTPVVVLPDASATARAAMKTLHQATGRGEFFATGCPGSEEPKRIDIHRMVVADRAVYGTEYGGAIVFGRHPNAVLHGACLELPPMAPQPGVDFEVAVQSHRFDRGVQSLLLFVGVATTPRVAFGVEGDRFVPHGLRGDVKSPRMPPAALNAAVLGAVPADTPVLLALSVDLPETLTPDTLKAALGKQAEGGITRQAAILWWPSGNTKSGSEDIAVVWSRVEDEAALKKVFVGARVDRACGTVAITLKASALERVRAACSDRAPSMANASPEVKAGLTKKSSVTLGVDFGRLTNRLMLDAWDAEHPKKKTRPKQVEAAAKRLEELPYFGFTGTVDGDRLVPGGFGS